MKKFTKGCLVAALVFFVIGCAFCGIFGALGGYRQLENLELNQLIPRGIGWGFGDLWFDIWDGTNWLWGGDDWWDDSYGNQSLSASTEIQTDYLAADLTDIDIEVGGNNLVILESTDDHIWIENKSSANGVKYGMKNGVFKLSYNTRYKLFRRRKINSDRGSIYLHLPKDMNLNSIDIEVGAGTLDSIALKADEIDLEAGAGTFRVDGLQGDEINISIGAGSAQVGSLTGSEVSIEAGAGEVIVQDMSVENLDLEVAAGDMQIVGSINGNADIECAAGSIDLTLFGTETDYNYEVDCAVGDVTIGNNHKYSGIVSEKSISNGSSKMIRIDCATGDIDIIFK